MQNERGADPEWVKYLSSHLKSEKGTPYDYSKIKIVGGEEVCTWGFADRMYEDSELMNVVDVVGSHYTSESTENAQKLAYEENKELCSAKQARQWHMRRVHTDMTAQVWQA